MNKVTELTVITSHAGSELVADVLSEYAPEGVSVSDIQDVIDLEKRGNYWDYADDGIYSADKRVIIKTCFPIDAADETIGEIEKRLCALKAACEFDLGPLEISRRVFDGDAWRDEWKERFKPIKIDEIVVVPEWIKYEPEAGEKVVLIGSNMAFGTGEHETTSMCVRFLCKYVKPDSSVIDVGCGSGILGLSAAKLGAKDVVMTDLDECAVTAAKENAALNGVTNVTVKLKNLLDDESVKGDVIVVNIMAEVLIAFAPHIGKNLKKGGVVILSGILKDRLDKVKTAYAGNGFTFIEDRTEGEWSAAVFKGGKA